MGETMGLASVFNFGKYRGLSVEAVTRFDPQYLAWVRNNGPKVEFDEAARKAGQRELDRHRKQSANRNNGWAWGFGAEVKSAAQRWASRLIEIEHEERRKIGQETCRCFPNASRGCPDCGGAGWVMPERAVAAAPP